MMGVFGGGIAIPESEGCYSFRYRCMYESSIPSNDPWGS